MDFADLVRSQKNGTIVVIAIKGEGVDHLSESAKQACESIGSALIRRVNHGDSWAIVGRKGAPRGSVPEAASDSGPSKATFYLAPPNVDASQCSVVLQSSSMGTRIAVNKELSSFSLGITLAVLGHATCDRQEQTFNSSQYDELIDFIKLVPPGRIVLAAIAGEHNITDAVCEALEAIGSAIIRNVSNHETWVIIGRKGAPRGSVLEQHDQRSISLGTTIISTSTEVPFISATSAQDRRSSLSSNNDNSIHISSGHNNGLTVAFADENNLNVFHQHAFDAFGSAQSSQDIVNRINSLPNGRVVAMTISDNGTQTLTEEVKQAIEGLGSRHIRELTPTEFRGRNQTSWALIGQKGAPQGTVLEAGSNVGPSEVISHILPNTQYDDESCVILVESAGFKSLGGLQLTINGVNTSLPQCRGIRVVVLEENSCGIEHISSYDTSRSHEDSARLADFLASVPTGRIVVASVWEEAHQRLGEDAKPAFESVGSALIRSLGICEAWAIIGRKGAAPGSVPEAFMRIDDGAQSTAVCLGGVMKIKPVCADALYPLSCFNQGA